MAPTRRVFTLIGVLVAAGVTLNIVLMYNSNEPIETLNRRKLREQIDLLNAKAKVQAELEERLKNELLDLEKQLEQEKNKPTAKAAPNIPTSKPAQVAVLDNGGQLVLPVLLFACNRPAAVVKVLDDLIRYRPSREKFPIIVTQDCGHEETRVAISKYKDEIIKHIMQPDLSPIPNLTKKEKKLEGYFKISRHYKWALGQVFDVLGYKAAIIMEDDLNIAPDFFEYFEATYPLLRNDPSLYCVSAWNDNGKTAHIENKPELLYRSDFFPGLGWMLTDNIWNEFKDKWPLGFWDDWVRAEAQRKGRACIRPEICRTHTFGEKGVSLGLFYKTHLKFMVLNEKVVQWTHKDLSYLQKDKYDEQFTHQVYSSKLISLNNLEQEAAEKSSPSVRIVYNDKNSFKLIAKALNIMNDFKDGIPRTAYRGVVTVVYKGLRVYLTPPANWQKYDPSWT